MEPVTICPVLSSHDHSVILCLSAVGEERNPNSSLFIRCNVPTHISHYSRVDFNQVVHSSNKKSQVSPHVEPEHDNSADGETWDDGFMIQGKQVQVLCDNLLV